MLEKGRASQGALVLEILDQTETPVGRQLFLPTLGRKGWPLGEAGNAWGNLLYMIGLLRISPQRHQVLRIRLPLWHQEVLPYIYLKSNQFSLPSLNRH